MDELLLWVGFLLLPSLISVAIIFSFVLRFSGKRHSAAKYALVFAIDAMISVLVNMVVVPNIVVRLVYLLFFFLLSIYIAKTSRVVAFTAALIAITIICIANNLGFAVLQIAINSLDFDGVTLVNYIIYVMGMFITAVFLYFTEKLFSKRSTDKMPYPYLLWAPLAMIFVFAMLLESFYSGNMSFVDDAGNFSTNALVSVSGFEVLAVFVIAAAGYFALVFSYAKFIEYQSKDEERTQLAQQVELQKNAIFEARQRYQAINAVKHDFANHYSVLAGLINKGESQSALEYLEKINASVAMAGEAAQTGDPVIDVLIEEKLGRAQAQSTELVYDVKSAGIGTMNYDVCVILANALDNALNAAQGGSIALFMQRKKDFIVISIKNSLNKNAKHGSGIGLKNIEAAVRKYSGNIDIIEDSDSFEICILLNAISAEN